MVVLVMWNKPPKRDINPNPMFPRGLHGCILNLTGLDHHRGTNVLLPLHPRAYVPEIAQVRTLLRNHSLHFSQIIVQYIFILCIYIYICVTYIYICIYIYTYIFNIIMFAPFFTEHAFFWLPTYGWWDQLNPYSTNIQWSYPHVQLRYLLRRCKQTLKNNSKYSLSLGVWSILEL